MAFAPLLMAFSFSGKGWGGVPSICLEFLSGGSLLGVNLPLFPVVGALRFNNCRSRRISISPSQWRHITFLVELLLSQVQNGFLHVGRFLDTCRNAFLAKKVEFFPATPMTGLLPLVRLMITWRIIPLSQWLVTMVIVFVP